MQDSLHQYDPSKNAAASSLQLLTVFIHCYYYYDMHTTTLIMVAKELKISSKSIRANVTLCSDDLCLFYYVQQKTGGIVS